MPLKRLEFINIGIVEGRPDWLFAFGDHLAPVARVQKGRGSSETLRTLPNTVGVPIRRTRALSFASFFRDDDFDEVKPAIDVAFEKMQEHIRTGGTVVIPAGGFENQNNRLSERSPAVHAYIEDWIRRLEEAK